MKALFCELEAATLVIEAAEHGFYLYTFRSKSGESDTWHQSLTDAQHQAKYEWPDAEIGWQPVPDTVSDLQEFGRATSRPMTTGSG